MEANKQMSFLEFIPISIFGAVMGMCGLCFAWRQAAHLWGVPAVISGIIGSIAIVLFIILFITFLFKLKKYPSVLLTEFENPVAVSFFSTVIISLLLIPGVLLPIIPVVSEIIWALAALSMLVFAWFVLHKWINHQQDLENALPAWIIPVVGTLDVPIVGSYFHSAWAHEICLVFFGIGCVFAIILLTVIFERLLFQKALPAAVQPTLLIMIAPCALAFTGYLNLTGQVDIFASVLFYFNLFLLFLFGSKIILLPKICPFYISWWSVSFPLSAITITALRYAKYQPDLFHQLIAGILLFVASIVILSLFVQSLYRIFNGSFIPKILPAPVEKPL